MEYSAAAIANEFLKLGRRDRIPIGPMKLQKLVYLAHGWHLAFLGTPLIKEGIEAWKYGPVVPSLYREFSSYKSAPIDRFATTDEVTIDPTTTKLIGAVWEKYKSISAIQLSMMTHEVGFAWDVTRRGHENEWSSPEIDNTLIQSEFNRRATGK